jgi:hypothetical protein
MTPSRAFGGADKGSDHSRIVCIQKRAERRGIARSGASHPVVYSETPRAAATVSSPETLAACPDRNSDPTLQRPFQRLIPRREPQPPTRVRSRGAEARFTLNRANSRRLPAATTMAIQYRCKQHHIAFITSKFRDGTSVLCNHYVS